MHLLSFHSFVRVSVQLGALQICIITCFGVGIVLLRLFQAAFCHFLREIMCFCAQEFGLKLGGAFRYGAEEG